MGFLGLRVRGRLVYLLARSRPARKKGARFLSQEFKVRIEPHGRTVPVAAGQALLEAALAAGLNLPHSCKSGHCGSCRARLLSGTVAYPAGRPLGITAAEQHEGYILLCQARAQEDVAVEARLIANVGDVEIKTLPCRIARLTMLAPDVMQVWLRLPAVEHLQFQPGQYLDVLLDGARRRSFSIASPPHDSALLELHVRRVSGGGFTGQLFAPTGSAVPALAEGALLRIEGPVGQFSYRPGTAPVLMIAGGTGFAPLKSMLRHVLETGIRRDIHLYWGARHVRDLYEEALVLEWVQRYPQLRFTAVLSEASAAEAAHHRTGWVHEAVLADHPALENMDVYAAGPPAMIEAIRASFPSHGLSPERLYFDSFDYAPDAVRG
jgi:CDP-4-dehydro-6-deoxyglucose reductase, E3